MKKITLTIIIAMFLFAGKSEAQTMFGNTALTLNNGVFSLGVNAASTVQNSTLLATGSLAYFFHLGYGTSRTTDFGINIGKAWGTMYYGIDFEKSLVKNGDFYISGTLGGHYWGSAGADADLIASVKINDFYLTSGIDVDINPIKQSDGTVIIYVPAYVPVTFEFNPSNKMALTLEANIAINSPAFTTVGAGINFYFK